MSLYLIAVDVDLHNRPDVVVITDTTIRISAWDGPHVNVVVLYPGIPDPIKPALERVPLLGRTIESAVKHWFGIPMWRDFYTLNPCLLEPPTGSFLLAYVTVEAS